MTTESIEPGFYEAVRFDNGTVKSKLMVWVKENHQALLTLGADQEENPEANHSPIYFVYNTGEQVFTENRLKELLDLYETNEEFQSLVDFNVESFETGVKLGMEMCKEAANDKDH